MPKLTTMFVAAVMLLSAGQHAAADSQPKLIVPSIFTSHMVLQRDKPITVWGWSEAGAEVTVDLGEEKCQTNATAQGFWEVQFKARPANTNALSMSITSIGQTHKVEDILLGDVWVGSGQSNMEWPLYKTYKAEEFITAANHPHIRLYHVPNKQSGSPNKQIDGCKWKECTSAKIRSFSAVLYHFGTNLHADLSVPIGLIDSALGGSLIEPWIPGNYNTTKTFAPWDCPKGAMYNAMIAPFSRFAISGCIWYQGESDVVRKNGLTYFDKMKTLIESWRTHWGSDMPFYFVQIAPHSKYEEGQLPALWEAQVKALSIPHTGMAVTTDLVDNLKDIHPRNKHDVGARLARLALAKKYGKGGVYSGPLFKSIKIEGNKARICFAHSADLKSRDGKALNEFKVAGADGKFVPAKAEIDGETVLVSADGITPVTVRFGWHKTANPNLVNGAGLPASPFQSDNWQGATGD